MSLFDKIKIEQTGNNNQSNCDNPFEDRVIQEIGKQVDKKLQKVDLSKQLNSINQTITKSETILDKTNQELNDAKTTIQRTITSFEQQAETSQTFITETQQRVNNVLSTVEH